MDEPGLILIANKPRFWSLLYGEAYLTKPERQALEGTNVGYIENTRSSRLPNIPNNNVLGNGSKILPIMEADMFHQYQGEPTDEELQERINCSNHQLGYKLCCPNCGKNDTQFLRNTYWMCHQCAIWFTTEDAQPVYNVQSYNEADGIPEEIMEVLNDTRG